MRFWLTVILLMGPLWIAPTWAAPLLLNGLAPYKHLNKEYYLAALYTERPHASLSSYRSDQGARRLVVKVTTDRWSPRRFNMMWKQDIAINNDLQSNPAVTELVKTFTEGPATDLTVGDTLVISFEPGQGSKVVVNDSLWLHSESPDLFEFLANAWLGDIPSSQRFQSQLLVGGELDSVSERERLARFNALSIAGNRLALIDEWQGQGRANAEEEARRQAEAERAAREAEERRRAEREAERRREAEALAKAKREAEELARAKARAEAEAAALAEARAKAREEAEELAKAKAEAEALAEAKAAAEAAANAQAEAQAVEAAQRTARQQAERKAYQWSLYQWNVQRQVYPKVAYPDWARQLKQEGKVQLDLVLSRTGSLRAVTGVRPANAGLLGQSLRSAVEAAAPFGPMPDNFTEDQYRVTLRYTFKLDQPQAILPPKPEPPAFMANESQQLTDEQKAELLAGYQLRVREQILNAVEYPYWAESLGNEGTVGVRVRVNADGTLAEVQLDEASRHAVLNKELQDAVTRAAPFEAIPEELGLALADVGVIHEFKLK